MLLSRLETRITSFDSSKNIATIKFIRGENLNEKTLGYFITPYGEIIEELSEGDSYSIKRKCELKQNKITINQGEKFVKVYYKKLFEVSKKLNSTEVQFLNYLMGYMAYNTGILCCENGKVLTRQRMSEDTDLELRRVDQILSSLVENEILHKCRTGRHIYFIANPFIFMKGPKMNIVTIKIFENTKWAKN